MQSGVARKVGWDYFSQFLDEIDRNFETKFLREEVTDCNAVDGAWLWDSCRRLSLYNATCDAMLAVEWVSSNFGI